MAFPIFANDADNNQMDSFSTGLYMGLPFVGGVVTYQTSIVEITSMVGSMWSSGTLPIKGNAIEVMLAGKLLSKEKQSVYLGISMSIATYDLFSSDGVQKFWGTVAIPIGFVKFLGNSPYWIDFKIAPTLYYYSYVDGLYAVSAAISFNRKL